MPAWLSILQKLLLLVLSALAARNSQIVPINDWQVLLPAAGAGVSFGIGSIWNLFNSAMRTDASLALVAKLVPYREKMLPQEVRDAVFNAMRWRFSANPDAVAHVDALILLDMQMSSTPTIPPAAKEAT